MSAAYDAGDPLAGPDQGERRGGGPIAGEHPEAVAVHGNTQPGSSGPASGSAANVLALPLEQLYGLPEGITITRDPWRISDLRWLVHDRKTGLGEVVTINPDDYMVPWSPPPKPKWWRWLSPLGAAIDALDRAMLTTRLRGTKVVDWFAVETQAKKQGGDAMRRLLDARA